MKAFLIADKMNGINIPLHPALLDQYDFFNKDRRIKKLRYNHIADDICHAKYERGDNYLDYKRLFRDGLLKINPKYPFRRLHDYRLGDRTTAELCTYHG